MKVFNETKSRIFQAVMELLDETDDIEAITMREIAKRANVSLGLINYYFTSKDELLISSLSDRIIKMYEDLLSKSRESPKDAVEKFVAMLTDFADYMFEYEMITRKMVEYVLTKGNMETASFCLPFLREIFGKEADEITLRIKAFRIITILQSVFMRSYDFKDYTGIDFADKEQRDEFVRKTIIKEVG